MNHRWSTIVTAGASSLSIGFAQPALGLSDQQRIERLETIIERLEHRLELSESENSKFRDKLSRETQKVTHETQSQSTAKQNVTPATKKDVAALDTKVKLLERRVEVDKEANENKWLKLPKNVELGSQGLKVVSSDENFIMYLRALIQADASFFFDDEKSQPINTNGSNIPKNFYMRRIRPIIEGTVWKYVDYRIMPDFAPGPSGTTSPRIFDAIADLRYFREASLAAGIMKAPVSLERLASASHLSFVERAWPTQLAPNREMGFLLHGEFDKPGYPSDFSPTGRNMTITGNFPMYMYPDFISYQLGVYNGTSNNGSLYSDGNDSKDFQGRIFTHPFLHSGIEPLEGLGIGIAGTYGDPNDTALSSFQSPGLQNVFTYNSATKADGNAYRIYPQGYWIYGPFKLVGEYALSNQDLANQTLKSGYTTNQYSMNENIEAWNITADYVLTGEANSFLNQGIKPRHNFNPFDGGWGAVVLAARFTPINFDDSTFRNVGTASNPVYPFADPRTSVESATTWGLGLNWWLSLNTKLMFDYSQTSFNGGAVSLTSSGAKTNSVVDRETEKVFQTRVQLAF
ncbi:MAG: porin [Methylococcaceae bacterium]|jgi:phosphate-selective porin OprO/OprP